MTSSHLPSSEPANSDGTPANSDGTPANSDDTDAPATAADATDPTPSGGDDTSAGTGQRFIFIDTEATGLDHARHELTEVAWVVRFEDGREEERVYYPEHTLDAAEDDALRMTNYHDRIAPQQTTPMSEWLGQFLDDAEGAVLVGAVPDFDARHVELACRKLGLEPTWDHHLLDVETLALPLIAPGPERPRSLARTCEALGIEHDRDQAHGALYDARQAMAVFDRVWEVTAQLRASGDPLPPPVPRRGSAGADAGDAAPEDQHAAPDATSSPTPPT